MWGSRLEAYLSKEEERENGKESAVRNATSSLQGGLLYHSAMNTSSFNDSFSNTSICNTSSVAYTSGKRKWTLGPTNDTLMPNTSTNGMLTHNSGISSQNTLIRQGSVSVSQRHDALKTASFVGSIGTDTGKSREYAKILFQKPAVSPEEQVIVDRLNQSAEKSSGRVKDTLKNVISEYKSVLENQSGNRIVTIAETAGGDVPKQDTLNNSIENLDEKYEAARRNSKVDEILAEWGIEKSDILSDKLSMAYRSDSGASIKSSKSRSSDSQSDVSSSRSSSSIDISFERGTSGKIRSKERRRSGAKASQRRVDTFSNSKISKRQQNQQNLEPNIEKHFRSKTIRSKVAGATQRSKGAPILVKSNRKSSNHNAPFIFDSDDTSLDISAHQDESRIEDSRSTTRSTNPNAGGGIPHMTDDNGAQTGSVVDGSVIDMSWRKIPEITGDPLHDSTDIFLIRPPPVPLSQTPSNMRAADSSLEGIYSQACNQQPVEASIIRPLDSSVDSLILRTPITVISKMGNPELNAANQVKTTVASNRKVSFSFEEHHEEEKCMEEKYANEKTYEKERKNALPCGKNDRIQHNAAKFEFHDTYPSGKFLPTDVSNEDDDVSTVEVQTANDYPSYSEETEGIPSLHVPQSASDRPRSASDSEHGSREHGAREAQRWSPIQRFPSTSSNTSCISGENPMGLPTTAKMAIPASEISPHNEISAANQNGIPSSHGLQATSHNRTATSHNGITTSALLEQAHHDVAKKKVRRKSPHPRKLCSDPQTLQSLDKIKNTTNIGMNQCESMLNSSTIMNASAILSSSGASSSSAPINSSTIISARDGAFTPVSQTGMVRPRFPTPNNKFITTLPTRSANVTDWNGQTTKSSLTNAFVMGTRGPALSVSKEQDASLSLAVPRLGDRSSLMDRTTLGERQNVVEKRIQITQPTHQVTAPNPVAQPHSSALASYIANSSPVESSTADASPSAFKSADLSIAAEYPVSNAVPLASVEPSAAPQERRLSSSRSGTGMNVVTSEDPIASTTPANPVAAVPGVVFTRAPNATISLATTVQSSVTSTAQSARAQPSALGIFSDPIAALFSAKAVTKPTLQKTQAASLSIVPEADIAPEEPKSDQSISGKPVNIASYSSSISKSARELMYSPETRMPQTESAGVSQTMATEVLQTTGVSQTTATSPIAAVSENTGFSQLTAVSQQGTQCSPSVSPDVSSLLYAAPSMAPLSPFTKGIKEISESLARVMGKSVSIADTQKDIAKSMEEVRLAEPNNEPITEEINRDTAGNKHPTGRDAAKDHVTQPSSLVQTPEQYLSLVESATTRPPLVAEAVKCANPTLAFETSKPSGTGTGRREEMLRSEGTEKREGTSKPEGTFKLEDRWKQDVLSGSKKATAQKGILKSELQKGILESEAPKTIPKLEPPKIESSRTGKNNAPKGQTPDAVKKIPFSSAKEVATKGVSKLQSLGTTLKEVPKLQPLSTKETSKGDNPVETTQPSLKSAAHSAAKEILEETKAFQRATKEYVPQRVPTPTSGLVDEGFLRNCERMYSVNSRMLQSILGELEEISAGDFPTGSPYAPGPYAELDAETGGLDTELDVELKADLNAAWNVYLGCERHAEMKAFDVEESTFDKKNVNNENKDIDIKHFPVPSFKDIVKQELSSAHSIQPPESNAVQPPIPPSGLSSTPTGTVGSDGTKNPPIACSSVDSVNNGSGASVTNNVANSINSSTVRRSNLHLIESEFLDSLLRSLEIVQELK